MPPTRNSELWDGTNKGVPGSAQFGRVSETRRAAKPRAANRRLGRQRRRCVPKQEKQYKKHKNKEHLGENAGPSFTSCCFARGHATSMVPSLRHLFSPQSPYALTRTTNSPSIHPTTQRLCAQQQNTIVRPCACARNSDDPRVLIVIDIAFVTTATVTTASIQQRLDSSSSSSRTQFQFGSVALRPGPAQNRR